jgi:hypothetical protein
MDTSIREIMKSAKKVKVRPEQPGTPILVRLQQEDLDMVDEWRAKNGSPTRPEAIRRMIRSLSSKGSPRK